MKDKETITICNHCEHKKLEYEGDRPESNVYICTHPKVGRWDITDSVKNTTVPKYCPLSDENWKVRTISIEFNTFGEFAGQYTGQIHFFNKFNEEFSFFIYPEMTKKYMSLISEELAESADLLGKRIKKSFGLDKSDASKQNNE